MKYNLDFFDLNKRIKNSFNLLFIINSIVTLLIFGSFLIGGKVLQGLLLLLIGALSSLIYFAIKRLFDIQNELVIKTLKIEQYLTKKDGNFSKETLTLNEIEDKSNTSEPLYTYQYTDIDEQKMKDLFLLIKEAKKPFSLSSNNNKTNEILNTYSKGKDTAINIIETYKRVNERSILKDLKSMNSSFEKIKKNLFYFIETGIIEENHPHEVKVKWKSKP